MSYTILNTLGGEKSATGVIPGTYGSNTSVSQITVDRYGRITAASNVTITGGGGSSQWINDAIGIHYLSNVGIGTSTPGAMLDVVTNATPGVGALMAQFGTSATARLQFYDENGSLPPYIYGAAGNGLGLASSGPITFYPNENPIGNPIMYVNSTGAELVGQFYVHTSSGLTGALFDNNGVDNGTLHHYLFSSDSSANHAYTLAVCDNDASSARSSEPNAMVNLSRLDNNGDTNFHLEFANTSNNSADHTDYGVGFGFYDSGLQGASTGQSPFIICPHSTTPFENAATHQSAISIAMDGSRNVGIGNNYPSSTLTVHGNVFMTHTAPVSGLVIPPNPMTANPTKISGKSYGNGVYTASGSVSDTNSGNGWALFDGDTSSTLYSQVNQYDTGGYIGTITTIVNGTPVAGETIQIQFPSAFSLNSYTLWQGATSGDLPGSWIVAGSNNNGTTWSQVDSKVYANFDWTPGSITVTGLTGAAYSQYILIVTATVTNGSYGSNFQLAEWSLNTTIQSTEPELTVVKDALFSNSTGFSELITTRFLHSNCTTYGNAYFVTVSNDGNSIYSSDGNIWINPGTISSHLWNSIAYGNGYFVAVTSDVTAISNDNGKTWTAGGSTPGINSVVAYGNGYFVIVTLDGFAYYSNDNGTSWNPAISIPSVPCNYIAYGYVRHTERPTFVAIADSKCAFSNDNGDNWAFSGRPPSIHPYVSMTYGNNLFVIVSSDGFGAFSADGDTWTDTRFISTHSWISVSYGNGYFVAVSTDGFAAYSVDGDTWTDSTIPIGNWSTLAYGAGRFMTLEHDTGSVIYSTTHGVTWSNSYAVSDPSFTYISGGNVYANVLQLSNTTDIYSSTLAHSFTDSPYTTALSSDGTTLVLGYTSRIDIFDIATQSVVYTDSTYTGWSVSINANATVLIVGVPTSAQVAIYRKTSGTWAIETSISGSNSFGFSVSVNSAGDKFLVNDFSTSFGGSNPGLADSAYMYTYGGSWSLTTTFNFSDPVSSVALSGNSLTCVFGTAGYDSLRGRVYVTQDLGATYTTFDGNNNGDWFGYYVSSNYDGTRIVANSSNGDPSNYIKIFTLE